MKIMFHPQGTCAALLPYQLICPNLMTLIYQTLYSGTLPALTCSLCQIQLTLKIFMTDTFSCSDTTQRSLPNLLEVVNLNLRLPLTSTPKPRRQRLSNLRQSLPLEAPTGRNFVPAFFKRWFPFKNSLKAFSYTSQISVGAFVQPAKFHVVKSDSTSLQPHLLFRSKLQSTISIYKTANKL